MTTVSSVRLRGPHDRSKVPPAGPLQSHRSPDDRGDLRGARDRIRSRGVVRIEACGASAMPKTHRSPACRHASASSRPAGASDPLASRRDSAFCDRLAATPACSCPAENQNRRAPSLSACACSSGASTASSRNCAWPPKRSHDPGWRGDERQSRELPTGGTRSDSDVRPACAPGRDWIIESPQLDGSGRQPLWCMTCHSYSGMAKSSSSLQRPLNQSLHEVCLLSHAEAGGKAS